MVAVANKNQVGSVLRLTIADAIGKKIPSALRDYLLNLNSREIADLQTDSSGIVQEILKHKSVLTAMVNHRSKEFSSVITDDLVEIWVDSAIVNGATPELQGLGDLVEKSLSAVGITKDRYARVTGKKKGCGKCTQRQASLNRLIPFRQRDKLEFDHMQFLYCYFHNAAKQDELRWSMRAIDAYYQGEASFLVIGDKPPWYDGPFIEHPRVRRSSGFRRGLRDVLFKMNTVQNHPLVNDEFFWMMDDVFLLRPVSKQTLITPRAFGQIRKNRTNGWKSVGANTGDKLKELGLHQRDFATHLGHHIEKEKLQELFQEWNPVEEIFLWEVAYGNTFHPNPESAVPYLRRCKNRGENETYYRFSKTATFLNVYSNAWCQPLRNWLCKKFPEPHVGEIGPEPMMNFSVKDTTPDGHYLLVQSSYKDVDMSRYRLGITKEICAPTIAAQHERVKLVVSVCATDPLLEERKQVFREARPNVDFVYRDPKSIPNCDTWNLPCNQRIVITRLDDADALSSDHCELTWESACETSHEKAVLGWPSGYIRVRDGKLHRMRYRRNQFCSLVTNDGMSPHVLSHVSTLAQMFPTVSVNNSRGWVWNQHEKTNEKADHWIGKVADPANANRWAIPMN